MSNASRRWGQPIPSNDLRIAANALEHGASLLTLDAHFTQVDRLSAARSRTSCPETRRFSSPLLKETVNVFVGGGLPTSSSGLAVVGLA